MRFPLVSIRSLIRPHTWFLLIFLLTTFLAARVPTKDLWYTSKSGMCNMDHMEHAPVAERIWEPERAIDPHAMSEPQELYEVTQFPGEQATVAQRREAEAFVKKCRESAVKHGWLDFAKAAKDGYSLMYGDSVHYVNMAYALDDRQLDPDRPEFLFFTDTPSGKRLAAFMFLARGPDDHGRQFGGPLTLWHFHAWSSPACLRDRRVAVGMVDSHGQCTDGVPTWRSPEMLHVWLIDHPDGPFATDMSISDEMQKKLIKLQAAPDPE